ncbi:hypothetical protein HG536_0C00390 [Torulaspora globosa]|uniref:Zn(2)-C6 fungal-type domain-containing protein n=1 Tax=Torulaspora globosa TaxID=48254 RepID=A0A7G3ZED6_9SACH|nr:uncharacterized protein HG536_0C00390 [Torulaspora globosa]QLL31872.1 hypothetical protein HG536_0C00390 [Torulaspora globosa]
MPAQQPHRRMVQSTTEPQDTVAAIEIRESVSRESGAAPAPREPASSFDTQPPSNPTFETAKIQSTKSSYDDNPLLSITQPTSAPNNTPVQSPPESPGGGRDAPHQRDESPKSESGSEEAAEDASCRRPSLLPPPHLLLGGGSRDHVGERYTRGSRQEDENSPISIINRRQIFSTSDSRSTGSSQQVAGPPGARKSANSDEKTSEDGKKSESGGNESSGDELGVAPQSFYFDKDRSVTDPHVKHDQADEKINISSWLKSRHGAEVYSLSDSAGNGKSSESSRHGTKESEQFSMHDGLISPQAPRSALSMGSSCGRVMSRGSVPEELSTKDGGEEDDENYVPPPPPKFINSKLDGVRSRLLLNPRVTPPNIDADMGTATAAAVLSNMRSSPFHFPERSQQYSSRPGSSSFSKSYPRPIIRIHHREYPMGENDENAVLDGDEDNEDGDAGGSQKQEDFSGVVKTTGERLRKNSMLSDQAEREVTWNKSGKRINRRLTATSPRSKRPKKSRSRTKASHTDDDGSRISDDGDESYTLNDYHDEDEEEDDDSAAKSVSKASRQKAGLGSRSRTGCWICRLRKKKCTEEKPSCFNCERLNLECHYDAIKPDFVSDPKKKMLKLLEIKTKTKEAKRNAMRKKPSKANS